MKMERRRKKNIQGEEKGLYKTKIKERSFKQLSKVTQEEHGIV